MPAWVSLGTYQNYKEENVGADCSHSAGAALPCAESVGAKRAKESESL